jgi:tetratricopeptide (TPR) repeat protein
VEANLASVDRHRGVLAFLTGHPAVALDHFTRALERQRSPENVSNVLASLLKLGELEEAEAILGQVRRTMSPALVRELDSAIEQDPDLAVLRSVEGP